MNIVTRFAAASLAAAMLATAPASANVPSAKRDYRVTYDAKHDRYCIAPRLGETATGTRINMVECKSTERWAQQGVTIERRR